MASLVPDAISVSPAAAPPVFRPHLAIQTPAPNFAPVPRLGAAPFQVGSILAWSIQPMRRTRTGEAPKPAPLKRFKKRASAPPSPSSSEDESESEEESEEEVESTPRQRATALVDSIKARIGVDTTRFKAYRGPKRDRPARGLSDQANYTVALLTNGNLLFTKVNGMAGGGDDGSILRAMAQDSGFQTVIFVPANFGESSRHAEMCILHHVGKANLGTIEYMACVETNCAYCFTTLQHYGCDTTVTTKAAKSQSGWSHPFYTLAYGTQNGAQAHQLRELEAIHNAEASDDRALTNISALAAIGRPGTGPVRRRA